MSLIVKKYTHSLALCLSFLLYVRETLEKYSAELVKVSNCLLKLMAKNLLINPEQLTNMFDDGRQAVRMNYYPPCVHASKVIGLTPTQISEDLPYLFKSMKCKACKLREMVNGYQLGLSLVRLLSILVTLLR